MADVLMLARLHKTQQALLAKLGPSSRRKPQQKPVTRALIVLPYLSIGALTCSQACSGTNGPWNHCYLQQQRGQ